MRKKTINSKPIRVLAIVCQLNPGGLENRLMDIIRSIDKSRVVIDVFTYREKPGLFDKEVKKMGGIVYYNPPLNVRNMFWYVHYFRRFLISHSEYKIVHAHQDAWCSVFCMGAYMARVPVRIAHSRTAISPKNLGHCVKNIIKIPTKKYANHYFAVSEKAGRWLYGDRMFNRGRVVIWPNAIDAKRFYYNEEVRKKVRNTNGWKGKYVIIHVGNYTYPKNHPFLLRIFNEVYKRDGEAVLVLVGTGDNSAINQIKKYIRENKLEKNVQILGSRNDVNELLQGADVFLFPSIFEGLPGALVEAQASGLPCVMSDVIAHEVKITPNLTERSLSDSSIEWAKDVLRYKGFQRKNTRKYIENKGFDVFSLSEKYCEFYEKSYLGEYKTNGYI